MKKVVHIEYKPIGEYMPEHWYEGFTMRDVVAWDKAIEDACARDLHVIIHERITLH